MLKAFTEQLGLKPIQILLKLNLKRISWNFSRQIPIVSQGLKVNFLPTRYTQKLEN
jgi:hypothetical protein